MVNVPPSPASVALASVAVTEISFNCGTTRSARHAVVPAFAGAVVEVDVEVTVMSALSALPASSVTVNRTTAVPEAGACNVAADVFGLVSDTDPLTTDQA